MQTRALFGIGKNVPNTWRVQPNCRLNREHGCLDRTTELGSRLLCGNEFLLLDFVLGDCFGLFVQPSSKRADNVGTSYLAFFLAVFLDFHQHGKVLARCSIVARVDVAHPGCRRSQGLQMARRRGPEF